MKFDWRYLGGLVLGGAVSMAMTAFGDKKQERAIEEAVDKKFKEREKDNSED